ncbi:hypothetical protein EDB87DRAFT_1632496 [Lactarius vividus]|nr:hypothetical protein EDB87DRAFT_1632496 [Lactarius vividus]
MAIVPAMLDSGHFPFLGLAQPSHSPTAMLQTTYDPQYLKLRRGATVIHPHTMHSFVSTDARCPLIPTQIVGKADKLMNQAQILYGEYEHIINPRDRIVAESRMAIAEDFKHGAEKKSWLDRRAQAKLYLSHAKEALETVKESVGEAIESRSQKEGMLT